MGCLCLSIVLMSFNFHSFICSVRIYFCVWFFFRNIITCITYFLFIFYSVQFYFSLLLFLIAKWIFFFFRWATRCFWLFVYLLVYLFVLRALVLLAQPITVCINEPYFSILFLSARLRFIFNSRAVQNKIETFSGPLVGQTSKLCFFRK